MWGKYQYPEFYLKNYETCEETEELAHTLEDSRQQILAVRVAQIIDLIGKDVKVAIMNMFGELMFSIPIWTTMLHFFRPGNALSNLYCSMMGKEILHYQIGIMLHIIL